MCKKVIIYDNSCAFSALFKHYFSTKMEVQSSKDKSFILLNSFEYDVCFFMINNINDFVFFEEILSKIKVIFVMTPVQFFKYKIMSMEIKNAIFLEFNNDIKRDIMKTITFNLKLKNLI